MLNVKKEALFGAWYVQPKDFLVWFRYFMAAGSGLQPRPL